MICLFIHTAVMILNTQRNKKYDPPLCDALEHRWDHILKK